MKSVIVPTIAVYSHTLTPLQYTGEHYINHYSATIILRKATDKYGKSNTEHRASQKRKRTVHSTQQVYVMFVCMHVCIYVLFLRYNKKHLSTESRIFTMLKSSHSFHSKEDTLET